MPRRLSPNPDQPPSLLTPGQRQDFVRTVARKILQRHVWQVGPLQPSDQAVEKALAKASLDETTNAVYLVNKNQWTELELLGRASVAVSTYRRQRLSASQTLVIHRLASVDPENGDELAWGVRTFNSQTGKALAPLTPEQARAQYLASVSGAAGLEEFASYDYSEFMQHIGTLRPWQRIDAEAVPFTSDWIVRPDFGVES